MDSNPRSPVRETDLARSPGSCPVGPFSELIYTSMVVILAESPVNREYPNRHAARRDQFPHSAEQELLLDCQRHQLCVSATSSLAPPI
jgi:hypothetical protein